MPNEDMIQSIAVLVAEELRRATAKHGSMASAHEGWAIIYEEVDELWDEVKKRHSDIVLMEKEAIQVAAMAMRFIYDVCRKVEQDYQPRGDSNQIINSYSLDRRNYSGSGYVPPPSPKVEY